MARLDQIEQRLTRIETKVDSLLLFRGWVLGLVSTVGAVVSVAVTLIAGWWGGLHGK